MCVPSNGEIVPADHACPGEIVILADDTLKLNDILGNEKLLPHKTRIDNPMPLLRTTVEPQKPEQREALLNALAEIADTDPLLHFDIDTVTHEIKLSFLGNVQMEVICAILEEKYHVEAEIKEPTVIYMERPLINEHAGKGEHISFYKQGEFTELCAGPHLMDVRSEEHTSELQSH